MNIALLEPGDNKEEDAVVSGEDSEEDSEEDSGKDSGEELEPGAAVQTHFGRHMGQGAWGVNGSVGGGY